MDEQTRITFRVVHFNGLAQEVLTGGSRSCAFFRQKVTLRWVCNLLTADGVAKHLLQQSTIYCVSPCCSALDMVKQETEYNDPWHCFKMWGRKTNLESCSHTSCDMEDCTTRAGGSWRLREGGRRILPCSLSHLVQGEQIMEGVWPRCGCCSDSDGGSCASDTGA
eukprot:6035499-Amphidinium_carterae.1